MTAALSLPSADPSSRLIGAHPGMVRLRDEIRRAAASPLPVLIQGPTGAGKELVARLLHELSGRRGALCSVNVATIQPELADAELFGVMRGAYTGAAVTRIGFVEEAAGGTLYLDEAADLVPALQAKLLRTLDSGAVRPVGGGRERAIEFRLVVSVQQLPDQLLASGRWREDFYHRVAGIILRIPPLRERRSDLGRLSAHFLAAVQRPPLGAEAICVLEQHDWPGNVRELDRVLHRAAFLSGPGPIEAEQVRAAIATATRQSADCADAAIRPRPTLAELQRSYVREVLREADGDVRVAAQVLGVSPSALYRRLKSMGIGLQSPIRALAELRKSE